MKQAITLLALVLTLALTGCRYTKKCAAYDEVQTEDATPLED